MNYKANLNKFGIAGKLMICRFLIYYTNNLFANFLFDENPKNTKKWSFLSFAGHNYPETREIDFGPKERAHQQTMPDRKTPKLGR